MQPGHVRWQGMKAKHLRRAVHAHISPGGHGRSYGWLVTANTLGPGCRTTGLLNATGHGTGSIARVRSLPVPATGCLGAGRAGLIPGRAPAGGPGGRAESCSGGQF